MAFEFEDVLFENRLVSVPLSPYEYQKCQPRVKELRFIKVLAASGDNDLIECELFHGRLDKVGYFAALSYQWGDPSRCGIIKMNGVRVPVTRTLLEALQHLRKTDVPVLWIDALCINQRDMEEKNAHLKLMKDIYLNADIVCAYIGPEADGSERVMDILQKIDQSRRQGSAQDFKEPWTPAASDLVPREAELKAFFSRSYWHRVWIIQEIALSSRLRVFCGQSSVRWAAFEVLVPLLRPLSQLREMDFTVQYLDQMRLAQLQRTPIGLLQLLHSSRLSKATNPRDRVYGLLGLCFDGADFVVEPHYEVGEAEICLEITRTVIAKQRSLDIVVAQTESTVRNLPSWCPDYFSGPDGKIWERMAAYIAGFDVNFRMGLKSARWTATNNTVLARRDVSVVDDRLLHVRGYSLGTVDSIGCVLSDPVDVVPQTNTTPKQKLTALKDDLKLDEADKKVFRNLSQVLNMYTRTNDGAEKLYHHLFNFDPKKMSETSMAEFKKIQEWRNRNAEFMVRGVTFKKRARNLTALKTSGRAGELGRIFQEASATAAPMATANPPYLYSLAIIRSVVQGVSEVSSGLEGALLGLSDLIDEGLRLFTTDSGHIGWGPPSTQLGDRVYLVEACSMPVVLRPEISVGDDNSNGRAPRTFTVVGHGLVDEAMDGVLWSERVRGGPAELVTLQ